MLHIKESGALALNYGQNREKMSQAVKSGEVAEQGATQSEYCTGVNPTYYDRQSDLPRYLLKSDGEARLSAVIHSRQRRGKPVDELMQLQGRLQEPEVRRAIATGESVPQRMRNLQPVTKRELNSFMVHEGLVSEKARVNKIKYRQEKHRIKIKSYNELKKMRELEIRKNRDRPVPELNEAYFDFCWKKKMRYDRQSQEEVTELFSSILSALPKYSKDIFNAVAFLYKIYRCRNKSDLLLYAAEVMVNMKSVCDALKTTLSQYLDILTSNFDFFDRQSDDSINAFDYMTRLMDGPVAGACASIVSLVALSGLLPAHAAEVASYCVTSIRHPKNIRDLIAYLSDIFARIMNISAMWNSNASVKAMMLGTDAYSLLNKEFKLLSYYSEHPELLYSGAPQENKLSYPAFNARVSRLHDKLTVYDAANVAKADRAAGFEYMLTATKRMLAEVKMLADGSQRSMPFAFVLNGEPGIGKSSLMDYILAICAEVLGLEWDPNLVFTRDVTSEYWEGYDPYSNPFVKYTEIGNRRFSPTMPTADLDELQRVIDTQTFNCNMAFAGKGKVKLLASVVCADTNNKDFHVENVMYCPQAIRRRFVYITPVPKRQFRTNNGGIDYKASKKALKEHPDVSILDRYDFTIDTYIGEHKTHQVSTLESFTTLFVKLMCEHLESTPKLNDFVSRRLIVDTVNRFKQIGEKIPFSSGLTASDETSEITDEEKELDDEIYYEEKELDDNVYYESYDENYYLEMEHFNENYGGIALNEDVAPINGRDRIMRIYKVHHGIYATREEFHTDVRDVMRNLSASDDYTRAILSKYLDVGEFEFHFVMLKRKCSKYKKWWLGETILIGRDDDINYETKKGEVSGSCVNYQRKIGAYDKMIHSKCYVWFESFLSFLMFLSLLLYNTISARFNGIPFVMVVLLLSVTILSLVSGTFLFWLLWLYLTGLLYMFANIAWNYGFDYLNARVKTFVTRRVANILPEKYWKPAIYGVAFVTICAALNVLRKKLRQKHEHQMEEDKLDGDEHEEMLQPIEIELGARAPKITRFKTFDNANWNVMETHYRASNFNEGYDKFYEIISKNMRRLQSSDGHRQWGFMLGEYMLTNTHFLKSANGMFYVEKNDNATAIVVKYDESNRADVTYDISLLRTEMHSYRGKELLSHIADGHINGNFIAGFKGQTVPSTFKKKLKLRFDDGHGDFNGSAYVTNYISKKGDCGSPLVSIDCNRCTIVGIHAAGNDSTAVAIPITQAQIAQAKSQIYARMELAEINIERQFEMPHRRSLIWWDSYRNLTYFGKLQGNVFANTKSKLADNPSFPLIRTILEDHLPKQTQKYGRPMMRYTRVDGEHINPYAIGLRKMNHNQACVQPSLVNSVIDKLVDRITTKLKERGIEKLSPLTVECAINGVMEDPYINRINANTSAGYDYPGLKDKYIPLVDGVRTPSKEIRRDLAKFLNNALAGKMNHPLFSVALKDEPREIEKCRAGKTRLFYISNLVHLIASKMMLTEFYSYLVDHRDIICTAVGVDSHRMGKYLRRAVNPTGSVRHFIEGDWGGFDVTNPLSVTSAAANVVYKVHEALGFNTKCLKVLSSLLTDDMFPLIEVLRDVFTVDGLTPSGKDRTAEFNGLKNIIMFMMMWYSDERFAHLDFFEHIYLVTYGDDVIGGVSTVAAQLGFDNWFIRERAATLFNMEFTSASKDGVLKQYVQLEDLQFLKRTIVQIDEDRFVCPLTVDTIYKAFQFIKPSGEPHSVVVGQTACSMMYEIFNWLHNNRDDFEDVRNRLTCVLEVKYGVQYTLPTYVQCEERMWEKSYSEITDETKEDVFGDITPVYDRESFLALTSLSRTRYSGGVNDIKQEWNNEDEIVKASDALVKYEVDEIKLPDYDGYSIREKEKEIKTLQQGLTSLTTREKVLRRIKLGRLLVGDYSRESAASDAKDLTEVVRMENVAFIEKDVECVDGLITVDLGEETIFTVEKKFARPIRLYSGVLSQNVHSISVWDLVTTNPLVRATFRNYSYARFDIELIVTIAAGPGDRGLIMVSYQPFAATNDNILALEARVPVFGSDFLKCYLSQAKVVDYITLKDNNPLHLDIKYINHKPMGRLFNDSSADLPAATALDDFVDLGEVYIAPLTQFTYTNTAPVIQVSAFIKNCKLACPTGTRIVVETQSELKRGPVERITSALAHATSYLEVFPPIRPYAMASQMMFDAMSKVSAIFGWSRPVLDKPTMIMKMDHGSSECAFIGVDTSKRIVNDPQQELSVDPRICGTDSDDMVIDNIASRWAYVKNFTWNTTDVEFSPITSESVTAYMMMKQVSTINTYYQPTPLMFAVAPFDYWNGDILYRFSFAVGAYDRGKLGVWFEPNYYQYTNITANLDLNKQPLMEIDLSATHDVIIRVKWAKEKMWLESPLLSEYNNLVNMVEKNNGYIIIAPITRLQTPDSTSIKVHVFVRGENIRVNRLSCTNLPTARYSYESCKVVKPAVVDINQCNFDLANCSVLHFGEEVLSFRAALKRYVTLVHTTFSTAAGQDMVACSRRILPYPDPKYEYTKVNYTNNLFGYLLYAYLGIKGSIRRKHIFKQAGITTGRIVCDLLGVSTTQTDGAFAGSSGIAATSAGGAVSTLTRTNSMLEAEIPFQSPNLFNFAFTDDGLGTNSSIEHRQIWRYNIKADVGASVTDGKYAELIAAGEDFSLMHFCGAPMFSIAN